MRTPDSQLVGYEVDERLGGPTTTFPPQVEPSLEVQGQSLNVGSDSAPVPHRSETPTRAEANVCLLIL